jgi:NAD(P)H dehydrogenase (quinone)
VGARTLVIVGHPFPGSLCHAIAERYRAGAESAGVEVDVLDLATTAFEAFPPSRSALVARDDAELAELDPIVSGLIARVRRADHLVLVHPVWWGGVPAVVKAFIDRVFVLGVAYEPGPSVLRWRPLLTGRTARLIVTMDVPVWFHRLRYRSASEHALRTALLWFSGVAPTRVTRLGRVATSSPERIAAFLDRVERLGATDRLWHRRRPGQPTSSGASGSATHSTSEPS